MSTLTKCLSASACVIEPSSTRHVYSPMSFHSDVILCSISSIPATTLGGCPIRLAVAYFDRRLRTSSRSEATSGSAYASVPASPPNAATAFCQKNQHRSNEAENAIGTQRASVSENGFTHSSAAAASAGSSVKVLHRHSNLSRVNSYGRCRGSKSMSIGA